MRILITGASRGIGSALARSLRLPPSEHWIEGLCRTRPPQHEQGDYQAIRQWHVVDLACPEAVEATSMTVPWRTYDAIVLNAGVGLGRLLPSISSQELAYCTQVNLLASIRLATFYLRHRLGARQPGNVVMISSIAGLSGFSGLSAYSATKAGLLGFVRSAAKEWGPEGWRFNAVCPGFLDTAMTKDFPTELRQRVIHHTLLGSQGTVQDVVPVIEFLLSKKSRWITGQALVVDGGMSL